MPDPAAPDPDPPAIAADEAGAEETDGAVLAGEELPHADTTTTATAAAAPSADARIHGRRNTRINLMGHNPLPWTWRVRIASNRAGSMHAPRPWIRRGAVRGSVVCEIPPACTAGAALGAPIALNQPGSTDVAMGMHSLWVNALRAALAVAVLVSAAVHLYVYVRGFSAIPIIGPLFLANVIGGAAIAAAVALWRHWIPPLLAAGFGLSTVAAYWVSVIHGLFGVREVTGGWPEIVGEIAEYAAVVLGVAVATILWRRANWRRGRTRERRTVDPAGANRVTAAKTPLTPSRTTPSTGLSDAGLRRMPPRGRTGP